MSSPEIYTHLYTEERPAVEHNRYQLYLLDSSAAQSHPQHHLHLQKGGDAYANGPLSSPQSGRPGSIPHYNGISTNA